MNIAGVSFLENWRRWCVCWNVFFEKLTGLLDTSTLYLG